MHYIKSVELRPPSSKASSQLIDNSKINEIARYLRLVSNPIRLQIINVLDKNKELNVTEICDIINYSQPLISSNLIKLKSIGILKSRKSGQKTLYSIGNKCILSLLNCF